MTLLFPTRRDLEPLPALTFPPSPTGSVLLRGTSSSKPEAQIRAFARGSRLRAPCAVHRGRLCLSSTFPCESAQSTHVCFERLHKVLKKCILILTFKKGDSDAATSLV